MSITYTPTPGPLPGEPWMPSNGTGGDIFQARFCQKCARDKPSSEGKDWDTCADDEVCPILVASFGQDVVEWRQREDGSVTCVAFIPVGDPVPKPRCEATADMFGEARP